MLSSVRYFDDKNQGVGRARDVIFAVRRINRLLAPSHVIFISSNLNIPCGTCKCITCTNFPKPFVNVNQNVAIKITEQEKAVLQQKIDTGSSGLFKLLADRHPSLTSHEIQTCGLIKTGMTNKELSKLYGLSEKGYEQLRYRIKKKMNLKRDDKLIKHLVALSELSTP